MALQIWMPLTGNLNNQGLDDVEYSSINLSVDSSGKIGSCYSFDGNSSIINFNSCPISQKSYYTICAWLKPTNASLLGFFGCRNTALDTYQLTIGYSTGNDSGRSLMFRDNNTPSPVKFTFADSIEASVWQHWAFVYDEGLFSVYKNGDLISTYQSAGNTMLVIDNSISLGNCRAGTPQPFFNGKINDFRIYDHALSPKEVKEISKGLVLHYKLDDPYTVTTAYDSSGYGYNGTITGTLSTSSDSARYGLSTYTSSGDTNYITTPTLHLPGDAITMNFWFKSTNTTPGSNYHMPFEAAASSNQAYEMSIYKTGYLQGGLVIDGTRKVDNCTSTKLIDGSWHMCTMTYDGTTIRRYVDAVMEKSTAASGSLVTSSYFILGHYGTNTAYYSKEAYTSDVRLYTTALSEADIKELYETGQSIDNKGNIYAYEFKEE